MFHQIDAQHHIDKPNIIITYADDVGYGDIGVYGSKLIPTPHIDQLAADGIRFTSAYATSATCTPSRYSLLTGEYAFRNERARILPGDATPLIEPGIFTLTERTVFFEKVLKTPEKLLTNR